jgi:aminobenzoyl-glutamate utilization protein A
MVREVERIGVDELAVGREALASDHRMAVPPAEALAEWEGRARDAGVREDVLERTAGGHTGAVAVLERGPGPKVGLRVDLDAIALAESTEVGHRPADEGFRSEHEGYMHACGHDAHVAVALGVLEAVKNGDFAGTLKVFFQPAEEVSGGGKPMAEGGYADDLDYLLALHMGLGNPTGTVVAGVDKPLAMAHLTATFEGASAHAGKAPNEGANAMQAMAAAVQNAYAIPRHADGMTRVNFGRVEGGAASNIIAEEITLYGEIRGETTSLMEYTRTELERVLYAAAEMHDCDVTVCIDSESPRIDSDPALRDVIATVGRRNERVDTMIPSQVFGASEDATYLMARVQENGGLASYVIVGTDEPTGHYTPTFDVDEESLDVAVELLTDAVVELDGDRP